jgi:hypothetical protein
MSKSLKQFLLSLFVCGALLQVGMRCAKAEPPYELTLEDEFGNTLPAFRHRGELFAMGNYGQRYNVRVTNRTGRRVEAVVTVDGRDVISGSPGDFKRQRGYLIDPYGTVVIEGFRTNMSEVAAFRFTTPGNSYSSRMGSPENVGVIGAAFFPEAPPPPPRPVPLPMPMPESRAPRDSYDGLGTGSGRAAEAPAAKPAAPSGAERESPRRSRGAASSDYKAESYGGVARQRDESNIGTEYGESTYSSVVEVPFRRANARSPERVLTMRYDDRAGLEARGIVTRPRPRPRPYDPGPVAFPVNRFAPPPPPQPYYYE